MDQTKSFNWGPASFLIIYHVLLLASLPFYFYYAPPSIAMIITTIVLLYLTGLSITGGYHRYFAHKSFKAHPSVEAALLFFGSMTAQGSVIRWSFDHRLHHVHVDTDDDPYSIKKGFWYAHCMWLLEKPREIEKKVVADLYKKKWVVLQHKYYGLSMVLTNVMAFFAVGWMLNDYLGAFFMAVWFRIFMLHHFTWFINSLAHTWGDKPFCKEQSAVNNYVISLLTFGEGYHNYHHTYANDYRNGIKWYHFDPTKWLIWSLDKLGLATNLKRMDHYTVHKRIVLERKSLLLNQVKELWYVKKEDVEKRIDEISDAILLKISEFNALIEKYHQHKKDRCERDILLEIKAEIKTLKKNLKKDWKQWRLLSDSIMELRPI
jgi:stearoyl-CoA desaturase (delta-9 desaturase)